MHWKCAVKKAWIEKRGVVKRGVVRGWGQGTLWQIKGNDRYPVIANAVAILQNTLFSCTHQLQRFDNKRRCVSHLCNCNTSWTCSCASMHVISHCIVFVRYKISHIVRVKLKSCTEQVLLLRTSIQHLSVLGTSQQCSISTYQSRQTYWLQLVACLAFHFGVHWTTCKGTSHTADVLMMELYLWFCATPKASMVKWHFALSRAWWRHTRTHMPHWKQCVHVPEK